MRDGPPAWLHAKALATSAPQQVDDARVHAERWNAGIRLCAAGDAEDDAAWTHEAWSICFSLAEAVCLCNTLATSQDSSFEEAAWGRVYRRVFSLDSYTASREADPYLQHVWFYPMTERRLVFRLRVGPLVSALSALLGWARQEVPHLRPDAQESQDRLLVRGISLLRDAARRVGGPPLGYIR